MSQPLSLDQLSNEMRERQSNPTADKSAAAGQTVWDPDQGMFVHINAGEKPKANQAPLNILAKEPYFA
ncbi:MAG: hypothetical protein ACI30N_05940 [Muribaculaceae bacterium]